MQDEIILRTSILREMIPSDVWMYIFQLLSHNKDITIILPLKTVCKLWKNVFTESHLTHVAILIPLSVSLLPDLPNLRSLSIKTNCIIPPDYIEKYFTSLVTLKICAPDVTTYNLDGEVKVENLWRRMTNLRKLELPRSSSLFEDRSPTNTTLAPIINITSLRSLTSLRKLKISEINTNMIETFDMFKIFVNLKKLYIRWVSDIISAETVAALQSLLLQNLNQSIEVVDFPLLNFVDCEQVQKNYPKVQFYWYIQENSYSPGFDIYKGDFGKNNTFEGRGTYYHSNKSRYEGEWKNDKKDGVGTYFYTDGSRYEGEWKSNKKDGKGMFYDFDGEQCGGDWKNNMMEGIGEYIHTDGSKYIGEWKNGNKDGKGVFVNSDGGNYEGEWENDTVDGIGCYHYSEGGRYEGELRNGKREGTGTYWNWSDKGRYEGEWKNDMKDGNGVYFHPDGRREEGEWKYGRMIKRNIEVREENLS